MFAEDGKGRRSAGLMEGGESNDEEKCCPASHCEESAIDLSFLFVDVKDKDKKQQRKPISSSGNVQGRPL